MCSGELRSDLMLREGRCGEVEEQDWEGKEHPPLDILETTGGETKKMFEHHRHQLCAIIPYFIHVEVPYHILRSLPWVYMRPMGLLS